MQIIISNRYRPPSSAATKRFIALAVFAVGIIGALFMMLDYYSDRLSENGPATAVSGDKAPGDQARMKTGDDAAAAVQPQEQVREYKSNAVRASFRNTARTAEDKKPQHSDEKPFLPPKAPDGAAY